MLVKDILWHNEDYKFYYLPILKNAHSWGKDFFKKNFNFEHQQNKEIIFTNDEKSIIVFYREPLSRWFSGAAQWFWVRKLNDKILPNDFEIDPLMIQMIFSAGKIDDHTKLQREAFLNIKYKYCVFFDVGDINFEKNLIHYLKNTQKVKVNYLNLPRSNTIEESEIKINVRRQLQKAYNDNSEFQVQLIKYLKWDIIDYHMLKSKRMFYEC